MTADLDAILKSIEKAKEDRVVPGECLTNRRQSRRYSMLGFDLKNLAGKKRFTALRMVQYSRLSRRAAPAFTIAIIRANGPMDRGGFMTAIVGRRTLFCGNRSALRAPLNRRTEARQIPNEMPPLRSLRNDQENALRRLWQLRSGPLSYQGRCCNRCVEFSR